MSSQTIRRARRDKDNPYKAIRRATFEDANLSFEARGVLGYILVKPDDWEVQVTDLMRQGDIGRDKAYRIINELITAGYCKRVEYRTRGRIVGYTYLIDEEPIFLEEATHEPLTENTEAVTTPPLPELPLTVEPLTENTDHTNKEVLLIKKTTKEEGLGLKTHPPVVSPLIARGEPSQNGWVGLADDLPTSDSFSVSEEEANSNRDLDIPPIAANADEQSLSAAAPPGLTPAQALAYKVLTDPEITEGIYAPEKYARRVSGWITKYGDEPIKLIKWVGAWWVEREAGIVDIGALGHRIDNCEAPAKCPPAFLESDFYQRVYPLTKAEAEARDRALTYTGKAPPHPLGKLLDALPVPLWEEDPPC